MIRVHSELRVEVEVTRPDPQPWMKKANCLEVDTEVFFERPNAMDAPAKKYCEPCAVKSDCLIFALLTENPAETRYGWMGNTSPIERTRLYNVLKGISS